MFTQAYNMLLNCAPNYYAICFICSHVLYIILIIQRAFADSCKLCFIQIIFTMIKSLSLLPSCESPTQVTVKLKLESLPVVPELVGSYC